MTAPLSATQMLATEYLTPQFSGLKISLKSTSKAFSRQKTSLKNTVLPWSKWPSSKALSLTAQVPVTSLLRFATLLLVQQKNPLGNEKVAGIHLLCNYEDSSLDKISKVDLSHA